MGGKSWNGRAGGVRGEKLTEGGKKESAGGVTNVNDVGRVPEGKASKKKKKWKKGERIEHNSKWIDASQTA